MQSWRRNLAVLAMVQLLSTAGFSLIFPFLPLYVKELGIATRGSLEFWAGMVFSSQAVTMMISAPIWGAVATTVAGVHQSTTCCIALACAIS